jgi:hypothetical protein
MDAENETYELTDLYRGIAKAGSSTAGIRAARLSAFSECLREVREVRSNVPQEVQPHFDRLITIFENKMKDGITEGEQVPYGFPHSI